MKKVFVFMLLIVLAFSCKKKDTVSSQTIHGQVYNYATDSTLANVTVYLKIQGPGASLLQTVSGTNGSFTFNVPVHNSDDYTYELYIPSVSGPGSGIYAGLDGCDGDIIKGNINKIQLLCVVPRANNWRMFLPSTITPATYNDTFTVIMQQHTFHKNVPNGVYSLSLLNCPCPAPSPNAFNPINFVANVGDYPMGWWQVTLDKTVNGIHVIKTDSVYMDWATIGSDTISWQ